MSELPAKVIDDRSDNEEASTSSASEFITAKKSRSSNCGRRLLRESGGAHDTPAR
jgi:hypothetical protein